MPPTCSTVTCYSNDVHSYRLYTCVIPTEPIHCQCGTQHFVCKFFFAITTLRTASFSASIWWPLSFFASRASWQVQNLAKPIICLWRGSTRNSLEMIRVISDWSWNRKRQPRYSAIISTLIDNLGCCKGHSRVGNVRTYAEGLVHTSSMPSTWSISSDLFVEDRQGSSHNLKSGKKINMFWNSCSWAEFSWRIVTI